MFSVGFLKLRTTKISICSFDMLYIQNIRSIPLLTTRESTPVFSYMNFAYVGVHACSLLVVSKATASQLLLSICNLVSSSTKFSLAILILS